MTSEVNILLPDLAYSAPRNEAGARNHLYELYTKVFSNQNINVLPANKIRNILSGAIQNFFKISPGSLNVTTQGYSVLTIYAAALMRRHIHIIVHTWKVPGFSDKNITAYIYDYMLRKLISKSLMVVVASKKQERQIQSLFPSLPTFFAPVTVDAEFWRPKTEMGHLLVKYGLKQGGFVLTVGGNDRNEEVSMRVAGALGIPYVRVTKDMLVIDRVRAIEKKINMPEMTIILSYISDEDLTVLYHEAFVVLLLTVTETNPAGLSSLVEALSCGAVVAVGSDLAEGYVVDGNNGIVFRNWNVDDISKRLKSVGGGMRNRIRANARKYAIRSLNSTSVANDLRNYVKKILPTYPNTRNIV